METETIETKKCNNCLKRVTIELNRCPHCRTDDFTFDGAVIERAIKQKFNLGKSLTEMFRRT